MRARFDRLEGRKIHLSADLWEGETRTVSARGLFIAVDGAKFAAFQAARKVGRQREAIDPLEGVIAVVAEDLLDLRARDVADDAHTDRVAREVQRPLLLLPLARPARAQRADAGEAVLVMMDRAGKTSRSFSPMVDGRLVRFASAGNGKMKDNATGSLWNVLTGECEQGAMKGKRLEVRTDGRTMVRSRRSDQEQRLAG